MKPRIVMRLFALLILSMSYVAIMGADCGKCSGYQDCSAGQVCRDGTCGGCDSEHPCPAGQVCAGLRGEGTGTCSVIQEPGSAMPGHKPPEPPNNRPVQP
jgi:hypothetical protein